MKLAKIMMLITSLLFTASSAIADPITPSKPDLRNPAIWQEKPATVSTQEREEQCRTFQASVCPYAQDSLSDAEREAQRRDLNRNVKVREEGEWRRVKPR